MYFDTHAHLCDERFDADRDAVVSGLPQSGVSLVVEVACSKEEFPKAAALAEKYPFVYAAYGIHPHNVGEASEDDLLEIRRRLDEKKAVALGEIGLDYYYDFAPRELQKAWFDRQLSLARGLDVPAILHIRDAYGDCMDILKAHRNGLKGVMHCFSGSAQIVKECVNLGLYIAFGGAITFHNARKAIEAAAAVPLDRLLIETDCPYMTPVPFRGERNDPAKICHTCAKLSEIRGMEPEAMAALTLENGKRLFGI